ncbi:MAG: hypothetical protein GXP49_07065 [Deltaproteobacteria bacterium]|nr:hypothetical protein [Deltaproteobacteria bacterium]
MKFSRKILKALYFLAALYVFFLCIELMGDSFKLLGKDFARHLLTITGNPILGLMIGLLATSVMQSSSSTTSIVVGMVAAGTLGIRSAIPIVMGANIGTTVTNALVSMGHIRRKKEFELSFSGAIVHDIFNLLTVILFLPLEVFFHPIEKTSRFVSSMLIGVKATTFHSPIKIIIKPVSHYIQHLGMEMIQTKTVLATVLFILAVILLIFSLSRMVKIMRGALARRMEVLIDKYLFTGTSRALLIGLILTSIVQSSSVTTSLIVPLLGVGILKIEAAFPYMVGANIGTTVTAILASIATGQTSAVTIALCHLFFNLFGTTVFLPLKSLPIFLAKKLGRAVSKRRWVALVYVLLIFFVIPGILIAFF